MDRKLLILLGVLPALALTISASVPQNPLIVVSANGVAGVAICYPSANTLCYGYISNPSGGYPSSYSFVYTQNQIYSAGSSNIYLFPTVSMYGYSYSSVSQSLGANPLSDYGFFGTGELTSQIGSPVPPYYASVIIFGNSGTENVYYVGVGTNPGYYTFSTGAPYNISIAPAPVPQQNISNYTIPTACYAPIVNIISPTNGSTFYVGQTFTLQVQNNLAQLGLNVSTIGISVYINNQLYINGVFSSSFVGQTIPLNVTITSPGPNNITVLTSYQYQSGCVNQSAASITVTEVSPPSLQLTSIQPTTTVPYSVGYPIVSSSSATVYFTLTGYVGTSSQITCTATANLVSACGPTTGASSTSNSVTFTYSGPVYFGQVPLNLGGLTQGVYNVQLSCTVGNAQLITSQSILYAYNASTCNLYCQALGGYSGVGTCCGLAPGQALPSMVTGYPNATYFNSSTCSLVPIPSGQCVNNNDVPPPGYICLNSTTVAYVQYYCTENVPAVNPTTFGTINQTIISTTTCPSGTFCSYGQCVPAPISPQLIINVTSPGQGQTVRTIGGSINVSFSVNDTVQSQVSCTLVSNNNIITQQIFNVSTPYTIPVSIKPGVNTLVITCSDVANVTNSTTITFNVQTGYIPQVASECGIPYVCLSSTLAAVVNYSVVNGQCVYNITQEFPAMPGQYCFAGSLYNENQVNVPSLLYANECGPDAVSIYQFALTHNTSGTTSSEYLLQVAPFRCVIGNAAGQSQLSSFNGMIIPVCMPNGSIAEYQVVYDNSTGRIYYQLQNIQSCSGTCVAGLCFTSSQVTLQPPQLQSIIVPSNYTSPFPVTFTVYSPYETVYLTITYQTSSGTQDLYSGVVYSGQTVNLGLNLPQESGTLTITAEDPSGLSNSYQYQVTVSSSNVTISPIGPAPVPIVPSAPSGPISPTAAAVAAQAPLPITLIFLAILAAAGIGGYLYYRRRAL